MNNRPVIGVLTQSTSGDLVQYGDEFVRSAYVKFLEMAGAAVVAIRLDQPEEYYSDIFQKINGVLLPGGKPDLVTSPVARSARIMYSLATEANDKGDFFPVWGTCMGFQMMAVMREGKMSVMHETDSRNFSLPLVFTESYKESRLFGQMPEDIFQILSTENVTANFHELSLLTETYKKDDSLNQFFHALSVNNDKRGIEFVSTMEAFHYPFYGVQWHPEKNLFTWSPDEAVSHTANAIKISQYFANFFVNEARKNQHKFGSEEEQSRALIENDKRVYAPDSYLEEFFYQRD